MNVTQIQTTLAPLIAAFAGFLAGRGVFGLDAQSWIAIIGALLGAGATIWGAIATRKTAIVSQVAALPEVKEVTLDRTVAGTAALSNATPNNVKVSS